MLFYEKFREKHTARTGAKGKTIAAQESPPIPSESPPAEKKSPWARRAARFLEHVSIKWIPVNQKNVRQNKNEKHGFDSIKTKRALKSALRFKTLLALRGFNFGRNLSRAVGRLLGSSLTRRIVVLNLGGLIALLCGLLFLNQYRDGLISAYIESLQTQGEIIAAAIAASATVETDELTLDPQKLLSTAQGESVEAKSSEDDLAFSINPEKVGFLLRRLVSPTHTRARVYDSDGELLVDTHLLDVRANIVRRDLADEDGQKESWPRARLESLLQALRHISRGNLQPYRDIGFENGKAYPEVARALEGARRAVARVNSRGTTIILVAVPVQRYHLVKGVLLLSTQGDDIDSIIASEQRIILRVFGVAALIMLVLSLLLAKAIAGPVRRLSEAAERVRGGIRTRPQIPDFTARCDEIGHLSGALRDMTEALYSRIEAIERFAADVAHELKNPLTSLRSAVEILPRIAAKEGQKRLLDVITQDVRRLDRLISDISNASRLDAELARAEKLPVDMHKLLEEIVSLTNDVANDGIKVTLTCARLEAERGKHPHDELFLVEGDASRLGQVVRNLIDNARSFSPAGASVRLFLRRVRSAEASNSQRVQVEVRVEDDGPGIPTHALERIFERFYTDRPEQNFGQNSGLGLSISRQIVDAHGGQIWAQNRYSASAISTDESALDGSGGTASQKSPLGACFIVRLPALR